MSYWYSFPPSPRHKEPDVNIPIFSESTPINLTNFNEGLDESVFSGTLFYSLCASDAARHPSNPQIHPPETLRPPPVLPPQDLSLQSVESIFAELYEACATPPSDDPLAPSAGKPYVPWDPNDVADTPPPSPSPPVPPRTRKRQKRDASADFPSAGVTPTTVSDTPSSSPSPLASRMKKRQKTAHLPSAAAAAGITLPAVSSVEQENVHAHSERDCDSDTIRRPTSEASPRTPLATRMPQPQSTTASARLEGTTAEALSPTPRKRKAQSGSGARAVEKPHWQPEIDVELMHYINSILDADGT